MPGAGVVHHIIRVIRFVGRLLRVLLRKRTSLGPVAMSQRCQERNAWSHPSC